MDKKYFKYNLFVAIFFHKKHSIILQQRISMITSKEGLNEPKIHEEITRI